MPYFPMWFDLSSDPHENANIWEATMDIGWAFNPVFTSVGKHQQSVQKFPNLKPDEDFKRYLKSK